MRNDGRLMSIENSDYPVTSDTSGRERELDTGFAAFPPISDQGDGANPGDGIKTYSVGADGTTLTEVDAGIQMGAMAYIPGYTSGRYVLVVGNDPLPASNVNSDTAPYEQNLLYVMQEQDNADGSVAGFVPALGSYGPTLLTNVLPLGQLKTPDGSNVTGMSFTPDGTLYCVTDKGGLYEVDNWASGGFQVLAATATALRRFNRPGRGRP